MKFFRLLLLLTLVASVAVPSSGQSIEDILKALRTRESQVTTNKAPVLPRPNLQQSEEAFLKNAYAATFLLYRQDEGGNLNAACTATSVVKVDDGYALLTAAHCISTDYIYYVTKDEDSKKAFYFVDASMCGLAGKGLDFCLLHVKTKDSFAVVPLGVNATGVGGEPVAAISSPLGLGKQVFRGSIASPHMKRPVLLKGKDDDDKGNWYGYMLLQMPGVNPASSGSSLLCLNQRAICGVIVGVMATPLGAESVALPINIVVEEIEEHGIAQRAKDGPDEPTAAGVPKK